MNLCGINLIISKNREWTWSSIFNMERICDKRGPDNNGAYGDSLVSLSHNLLAITEDKDAGQQPIRLNHKVMVFNGEIYNYKELRDRLKDKYDFTTDSDTEVLMKGIDYEGINFLSKVDGMFAIILYDQQNNKIYLTRDPSGTKPLYYIEGEFFAASSMIECLLELGIERKINKFAWKLYETFGFVPGPLTLIEDIKKLTPGQILEVDSTTGKILNSYYIEEKIVEQSYNPEELREKISTTVRDCLIGRRKIGLYLSGGLDSSIILTEALKYNPNIETFTTRFQTNNPQDDAIFNSDANIAAKYAANLGVNHRELLITVDDFINAVEPCIQALEEPRSNPNTPAYYLLNKFVAEHGIVVTLSGDGGDEIFGGYKHHLNYRKCHTKFEYITYLCSNRAMTGKHNFDGVKIANYISNYLPNIDIDYININLFYESLCHLPEDYLIRNDKLGMNFSMEARFPFTCRKLKNYVLGIPGKEKFNFQEQGLTKPFKILLKNAYKGILPDYILEKEKSGWSVPKKYFINKLKNKMNPVIMNYSPKIQSLYIYFDIWKKLFNARFI